MSDRISCTIEDGVAGVRLTRPEKRNALDGAMLYALIDAGEALQADPSVRAVVLSGEGRSFSAGLDLAAFERPITQDKEGKWRRWFRLAGSGRTGPPRCARAGSGAGKSPSAKALLNLAGRVCPDEGQLAEQLAQHKLIGSADQVEAMTALLEQRAPRWDHF